MSECNSMPKKSDRTYLLSRKTDVLAKQRGYLAYSTADTAFESIPRSSLAVLNDFAEACDNPNEAEIAMLAQALRVPQVIIIFYCRSYPSAIFVSSGLIKS